MNTWRPTAIFVKTFFWYGFSTRDRIDSERWAHLIFHLVVWRRRDSITQSVSSVGNGCGFLGGIGSPSES